MIGTQLRKADLAQKYDTIIIGSGLSSLTLASILSRKKQKVLVLEKHYTAGGYTHTFEKKGFEWDVGVHYIGEVHKEHSSIRKMFNYITDGSLQWAHMGKSYDRVIFPSHDISFKTGKDNLIKELIKQFPNEQKAIEEYFQTCREAAKASGMVFLQKLFPDWVTILFPKKLKTSLHKWAGQTTQEVLNTITSNHELQAVLTAQWGDYGLPPQKSSFMMHATLVAHYLDGGNYPVGGSAEIAKSILPSIQNAGGDVVVSAPVKEIIVKNKKATGVVLETGRQIFSKNVVSGVGLFNTAKLLGEPINTPHGALNALSPHHSSQEFKLFNWPLKFVKPSAAHVCLYIGLTETAEELNLNKENLWIHADYQHDKSVQKYLDNPDADFPVVYVSFPSAKDPMFVKKHPGKGTIELITLAPYDWYQKWEGTKWGRRGEEYLKEKEKISQKLLEQLYKYVPQVKGHIKHYELSTPLSTKNFCSQTYGEIYGIEHNPERFLSPYPKPKTPIKNLYLTGQDIATCGIGGAIASGALTSITMLGFLRAQDIFRIFLGKKLKKKKNLVGNQTPESIAT